MTQLLNFAGIQALYPEGSVQWNIATQLLDETPDRFDANGRDGLYDVDRAKAWIESKMPPLIPHPTIWIPAGTAAGDKAALFAAGNDKLTARAGAQIAFMDEYADPATEGDLSWWHVSRACRMFGTDFPADSYVGTRSPVEMRDAGHVLLS